MSTATNTASKLLSPAPWLLKQSHNSRPCPKFLCPADRSACPKHHPSRSTKAPKCQLDTTLTFRIYFWRMIWTIPPTSFPLANPLSTFLAIPQWAFSNPLKVTKLYTPIQCNFCSLYLCAFNSKPLKISRPLGFWIVNHTCSFIGKWDCTKFHIYWMSTQAKELC